MENPTESEDLRKLLNDALRRNRLAEEYCKLLLIDYDLVPKEREICREVVRLLTEID